MRFALPIILSACLLLTPGTRAALGLSCGCGCPDATALQIKDTGKSRQCSCCCDTTEKEDQSPNQSPSQSPKRCPATPVCGEWCCGGGFVPLTILSTAPTPEPAIEPAYLAAGPSLSEGEPIRIEDPPRRTA